MDSCSHNDEIDYAIEYHEETKHSEIGLRMSHRYLDFHNKPRPFKVYLDLPSIALPADFVVPMEDALTCIRGKHSINKPAQQPSQTIDVCILAQLLFFSAGITREMQLDSGTYYMRAASATGALYPIELYVVCQDIVGLPAGVYHFCPGDFSLTKLRSGDYTARLAAMTGDNSDILTSPATIAFTSLSWRNAWKYAARSYRHWFWDSGVIAANLIAVALSAGLRSSLVMGFIDSQVDNLLLLKKRKEATIALAPIMGSSSLAKTMIWANPQPDPRPVPAGDIPRTLTLSKGKEIEYLEIWKLQKMSSLISSEEVREWLLRCRTNNIFYPRRALDKSKLKVKKGKPSSEGKPKRDQFLQQSIIVQRSIGDVILHRGSSRRFSLSAISLDQLDVILYSSTRCIEFDFRENLGDSFIDIYLIANAVQGLASGHYFYDRNANRLKQLKTQKEIVSRSESGYLCLDQSLFSNASTVIFLMADLDTILKILGNRGYRVCQFEAGIIAGKIYLSSYAQELGASGSTFFDDAVTEIFLPHAKGKATMISVGIGIPPYKPRPGKVLAARLTKSNLLASQ